MQICIDLWMIKYAVCAVALKLYRIMFEYYLTSYWFHVESTNFRINFQRWRLFFLNTLFSTYAMTYYEPKCMFLSKFHSKHSFSMTSSSYLWCFSFWKNYTMKRSELKPDLWIPMYYTHSAGLEILDIEQMPVF